MAGHICIFNCSQLYLAAVYAAIQLYLGIARSLTKLHRGEHTIPNESIFFLFLGAEFVDFRFTTHKNPNVVCFII